MTPRYTAPDPDGTRYRLVWTGACTCSGPPHEPECGWDVNDLDDSWEARR